MAQQPLPCTDWTAQWEKIVKKAWSDEAFKRRLVSNPAAVLKEEGLEPPKDTQVMVVENTSSTVHLTLPAKPATELSEEDLLRVVGGKKVGGVAWGGAHVRY
jgi:hypothetical protein